MEKVIKFLELHVQWFALGFAGLFLAWMAYAYLYSVPLQVQISGQVATPGTVDDLIKLNNADRVERAMKNKVIDPPKVADVLAQFTSGIDMKTVVVTNFDGESTSTHEPVGGVESGPKHPNVLVNNLPQLPPATPDKQTSPRWTVIMVAGPAAPAPAPAAPGQAPASAPQPVMARKDTAYYVGTFKLDMAQLNAQYSQCFANAKLPLNALNAEFVRVELLREEMGPNGAWSKPIVINTLPIHDMMTYPDDHKPALNADKLKEARYNYKDWLEHNQDLITHPSFYPTATDAEPLVLPGMEPPAAIPQPGQPAAERAFDPSRDTPRTPEERAQADAYRAQVEAARRSRLRPGGVGPGGGPGAFAPPGVYPGARPGPAPVNPVGPSAPPPNNVPPAFINPNGGANGFNPGLAVADAQILAYDATVLEGHTYRYAVRYKLYNPMFDKLALAIPAVAAKFDIDSPDPSDPATFPKPAPAAAVIDKLWTEKVTVPARVQIYVQKIEPFREQADFAVYVWKDGHWHETIVAKKTPGDPVTAGKDATPWTVVDVRKDPHTNEPYVLLMDNAGTLMRRDVTTDQADPEWQKVKGQVGVAAAASAR